MKLLQFALWILVHGRSVTKNVAEYYRPMASVRPLQQVVGGGVEPKVIVEVKHDNR